MVTRDNVDDACRIEVAPEQTEYVAPVPHSPAEAYVNRETAWPRLVCAGGEPVAFVMGGFDPGAAIEWSRCGVWRRNVAAAHQGKGYGRFAVAALFEEARRRGERRASVLWKPGEAGPEGCYRKLGFEPTGDEFHGQIVGALDL